MLFAVGPPRRRLRVCCLGVLLLAPSCLLLLPPPPLPLALPLLIQSVNLWARFLALRRGLQQTPSAP
jgi:hypothetical protein